MGEELKTDANENTPGDGKGIEEIQKSMDAMKSELQGTISLMQAKIGEKDGTIKALEDNQAKFEEMFSKATPPLEETDFDNLTSAELYKKTMDDVKKLLEKAAEVKEKVLKTEKSNSQLETIRKEVADLRGSDEEFDGYMKDAEKREALREYATKHPTLGVKEVFKMVKSTFDEKAQKIVKDKEALLEKERKAFTEGGGALPTELTKDKDLKGKSAAEKAWDMVMKDKG